jgi:hypothetical protein
MALAMTKKTKKLSIMSTEYALQVAKRHRDQATSKGVERYWQAVVKSLKQKLKG